MEQEQQTKKLVETITARLTKLAKESAVVSQPISVDGRYVVPLCRLGLGYPDGPIERVVRGGLAYHYDVSTALFEVYGTPAYAPARRAVVAKRRGET